MHLSFLFVVLIYLSQSSHADSDSSFAECGVSNLADSADDKKAHHVVTGNFPWHAAIYYRKNGTEDLWQNECMGTLIGPHSVLTDALCISSKTPEEIKVAFGKLKQQWNDSERNEIKVDVKKIHIHEGFVLSFLNLENHIGVLVLNSDVPVSSFVCLAFNAESLQASQTQPGFVVGWNKPNSSSSESLSYARVGILKRLDCMPFHLPLDSYCNGTELIFNNNNNEGLGAGLTFVSDGHHYLYGIVNLRVFHKRRYVVSFTNVSYHYNWIKDHMS